MTNKLKKEIESITIRELEVNNDNFWIGCGISILIILSNFI